MCVFFLEISTYSSGGEAEGGDGAGKARHPNIISPGLLFEWRLVGKNITVGFDFFLSHLAAVRCRETLERRKEKRVNEIIILLHVSHYLHKP